MRTRVISSIIVVVVALIPMLVGGPLFAVLMVALGLVAYREYLAALALIQSTGMAALTGIGSTIIVALAVAALVASGPLALFGVVMIAIAAPLILLLPKVQTPGALQSWSLASSGSLYVGLPVYAAVALRSLPGAIDAPWLTDLARRVSLGWDAAPRGLAWVLIVVLATWIGDSVAYLTGRSFGRRQLAPVLSPKKTVEGAVCGLLGSVTIATVGFPVLGLGAWWLGVGAGAAIGIVGQLGDLAESFLKRQAGVKDAGTAIPGHGGVLDRIDALLFAFPAGLLLAAGYEQLGG